MNHSTTFTAEIDQTDEDILSDEVSDWDTWGRGGQAHRDQAMVTVGPTILIGSCRWLGEPILTRDEARRIAADIAKLPELLAQTRWAQD